MVACFTNTMSTERGWTSHSATSAPVCELMGFIHALAPARTPMRGSRIIAIPVHSETSWLTVKARERADVKSVSTG